MIQEMACQPFRTPWPITAKAQNENGVAGANRGSLVGFRAAWSEIPKNAEESGFKRLLSVPSGIENGHL